MKRILTAWGRNQDEQPHILVQGENALKFANGNVDPECQKLFWKFDACSYEEAMAIYYTRLGWAPYKPTGESQPCPKCAAMFYPEGSGQCWQCDYEV